MRATLPQHEVVLLGAGHTNAHVLRMWRMKPIPGAHLTCVSNHAIATYSGMLPGALSGQYPLERMEIDLVRLCAAVGARLVVAEFTALDLETQRLLLRDRPALPFDVLSIGIGSVPASGGVVIDGVPDAPALGAFTWELITGAQGTLVNAGSVITTIPGFTYTSYYLDDSTPSTTPGSPEYQCTGDLPPAAYGASGLHVNAPIPCTDPNPSVCTTYYPFEGRRIMYFEAPGVSVEQAQAKAVEANTPLAVGRVLAASKAAESMFPPTPGFAIESRFPLPSASI